MIVVRMAGKMGWWMRLVIVGGLLTFSVFIGGEVEDRFELVSEIKDGEVVVGRHPQANQKKVNKTHQRRTKKLDFPPPKN